MKLNCHYHQDREAKTKCEICGKLICLECKMVLNTAHGTDESRYVIRHEICPLCFYAKKDKAYGKNALVVALLTTVPSILIIITLLSFSISVIDYFFVIIPISFIAFCWIYYLYYAPKKRDEIKKQKMDFLRGLTDYTANKKDLQLEHLCGNCGAKIEPNISICSYCGSEV
jgi:hypothetical protein